ncbi:MAG: protoporphyrinogen/coproporphyrinogen oxidase, partial [Bacteroidia bacterium]
YEKNGIIGGNCITTCKQGYCWDSGAHRIHNVYENITEDIKVILDHDLKMVSAPSHIFFKDKLIPFPFNIINVVKTFGVRTFLKATTEVLFHRKNRQPQTFEEYAVSKYGPTLAKPLLLNYTQKLWGISTEKLSIQVTGNRLTGLTPWQWLLESVIKHFTAAKHLEGTFYYPAKGIGEITEKLGKKLGMENIETNSAITGIYHEANRITHLEIYHEKKVAASEVVSTLPLPLFAHLFKPALPETILKITDKLQFRNLVIVAFAINKSTISKSASVYFPGKEIFTRIVEPKNRSTYMAPQNCTSLVVEIPCFREDKIWNSSEEEIIAAAQKDLVQTGLCKKEDITNAWVQKLPFAYPVLSNEAVNNLTLLQDYFTRFSNLTIAGRNGNFAYTHIHDLFHEAKVHFHI